MSAWRMLGRLRFISPTLPILLLMLVVPPPLCAAGEVPPVYLVLFTHIEDNTPAGVLGSPQSQQNYLLYRSRLIDMGDLALAWGLPWSLQPDWKILQAALLYETPALMQSTNNKNFLRYLKEDLGVVIDPHSHESGGYNYTDVAHLLDSLGVGSTTVIGGHVWDPSLPQFQEWDRYRVPVPGERYPWVEWRGDILMGSGTPNHVNDPIVSGVWRPRDRFHYFEHDSTANIAAIGQYKTTIEDLPELVDLYQSGVVPTQYMLTSSYPIKPSTLIRPDGLQAIADSVMAPVVALRDEGLVAPINFTALIATWETVFGARGFLFDAEAQVGVPAVAAPPPAEVTIEGALPNPFRVRTTVLVQVSRAMRVELSIYDPSGRQVAVLMDEVKAAGRYAVPWEPGAMGSGIYFCRLASRSDGIGHQPAQKLIVIR